MKLGAAAAKRDRVHTRSPRIAMGVALLWVLAMAVPAEAHEKHAKPDQGHVPHAARDSDFVASPSESLVMGRAVLDSAAAEPPFELPPIGEAIRHHLHNKLVHVPLVLAPIALVSLFLARRRPDLAGLVRVLAWLAALSAGAALWAGLSQASDFERDPKEWLVRVHRNWGIATTAALTLSALLGHWPRVRRYAWITALLAVMFVAVAGFLGGLVSHG